MGSKTKITQFFIILLFLQIVLASFFNSQAVCQEKTIVQENIKVSQEEFARTHEEVKKLETVELGKLRTLSLKVAFEVSGKKKRTSPPPGLYDFQTPPDDATIAKYEAQCAEDDKYNNYNNYVAQIERANKIIEETKKDFERIAADLSTDDLQSLSDPVKIQESIDKALKAQRKHQETVIQAGNDILASAKDIGNINSKLLSASFALKAASGILTATGVGLTIVPVLGSISTVIDSLMKAMVAAQTTLTVAGESLVKAGEQGKTTDTEYNSLIGMSALKEGSFSYAKNKYFKFRGKKVSEYADLKNDLLPLEKQLNEQQLKLQKDLYKKLVGSVPGQTKLIEAVVDTAFSNEDGFRPDEESDLVSEIYIHPAFKQEAERRKLESIKALGNSASTIDLIQIKDKNLAPENKPNLDMSVEETEEYAP